MPVRCGYMINYCNRAAGPRPLAPPATRPCMGWVCACRGRYSFLLFCTPIASPLFLTPCLVEACCTPPCPPPLGAQ
eukprot:scaffold38880_cov13-Tisochrysis_lutea.AAC.1